MELTDVQWELLKSIVEPKTPPKRRGRPWSDTRRVLEGVLWILRTGAQWSEMPNKFPPYQTCHRRFQRWVGEGALVELLRTLAQDLVARGDLDLAETFIDASFSGAKKGAVLLVQHAAAKGPRSWQLRTAMVFLSPTRGGGPGPLAFGNARLTDRRAGRRWLFCREECKQRDSNHAKDHNVLGTILPVHPVRHGLRRLDCHREPMGKA